MMPLDIMSRGATNTTVSQKLKITRHIGKEAQRSALAYFAMASVFTIPLGLVLTLLAGWPLFIVTVFAHILPLSFVWATADVFFVPISRAPLFGMTFGAATLFVGGCGFCVGLILLGSQSPFDLLTGLKVSLGLATIFILPAIFLGGLLSLRFRDIYQRG
jgi:hypothetical protein